MDDKIRQIEIALEKVRERPKTFIGSENPNDLMRFIYGFEYAMLVFGVRIQRHHGSHYHRILKERGWDFYADWPIEDMIRQGMKNDEIIDEMMFIEIEMLRRMRIEGL